MISKQTVFLTADRSKAVPEGHKDARFLLVREGHEVNDAEMEKYDGAESLVNAKGKALPDRPVSNPASSVPEPAKKRTARAGKGSKAGKSPQS